jgi:hypothetical protein
MKDVWVYRNLKHGKEARPLYSIMRNGRVIARRHRVLLTDATFVVREGGRQRVIREGRKNVHAFVKGRLVGRKGAWGIDANTRRDLPVRLTYRPLQASYFQTIDGHPVKAARGVLLNERGITACYTRAAI